MSRLERSLHRFKPGIAEDAFGEFSRPFRFPATGASIPSIPTLVGPSAQFGQQLRLEGMGMHIPHRMHQAGQLLLPGLNDLLGSMTAGSHPEGCRQIQITPAGFIPDMHALCPLPDDGPGAIGVHESHVGRLMSAKGTQGHTGWL